MRLPEKGEPLQLGDIAEVSDNPQVQKALRRLAAGHGFEVDRAAGHVASGGRAGLGDARPGIARLGQPLRVDPGQGFRRSSRHTCRKERPVAFCSRSKGSDVATSEAWQPSFRTALRQKIVLGLLAELGIPHAPGGPGGRVPRSDVRQTTAQVLVYSSDGRAQKWVRVRQVLAADRARKRASSTSRDLRTSLPKACSIVWCACS